MKTDHQKRSLVARACQRLAALGEYKMAIGLADAFQIKVFEVPSETDLACPYCGSRGDKEDLTSIPSAGDGLRTLGCKDCGKFFTACYK